MSRSLQPFPASRRARVARGLVLASALVVAACAAAYAAPLLADTGHTPSLVSVAWVEAGGDFVAWTAVHGTPAQHASFLHFVHGSPRGASEAVDRVLLLAEADLSRLLAGEEVRPLASFAPDPRSPFLLGDFPVPQEDSVLAWTKGDAWLGARVEDARRETSPMPAAEGPLEVRMTYAMEWVLVAGSVAMPTALVAALAGLACAAWWIVEERRSVRGAPVRPSRFAPEGLSTEGMIQLARLVSLYVEGIGRSFLVAAAAIVGAVALLLYAGLPPVLSAVDATFPHMLAWHDRTEAFFVLAPLYVGLVALVAWGIAYAKARRELAHWRTMTARFDADAAGILGA